MVDIQRIKALCQKAAAATNPARLHKCLADLRAALREEQEEIKLRVLDRVQHYPVAPAGPERTSENRLRVISMKRVKPLILCVEDDPIYLGLRKAVLEKDGYSVLGAGSAEEALRVFRETPVCLVLSDHMLRGTTGIELAAQMKQAKPEVPIVLYSGKPPESMRNVDCFINKGESVASFLSIIRELLYRYCA